MCRGPSTTKKDQLVKPNNIPWLAKSWLSIYNALPVINFPLTQLNVSFTLLSATYLTFVRFISLWVFASPLEYDMNSAKDASGSIGSIVHSTTLCAALIVALATHTYNPSEHRNKAPKWWASFVDAQLQFCTGYMVYDFIFIFLVRTDMEDGMPVVELQPVDKLFLGHHVLTILYMTQNRVYEAGHMSAMMCMLLGELSNPFHNSYYISEIAMNLNKGDPAFHYFIETAFAVVYFSIRVVIAPIFFAHISWNLLFSKDGIHNFSLTTRLFWVFMIWAVEAGSYSTIVMCYDNLKTNLVLFGDVEEQEM